MVEILACGVLVDELISEEHDVNVSVYAASAILIFPMVSQATSSNVPPTQHEIHDTYEI